MKLEELTERISDFMEKVPGNPSEAERDWSQVYNSQLFLDEVNHQYTSDCCRVPVRVEGGDEEDSDAGKTRYFVCTKCDRACNTFEVEHGS